MKLTNQNAPMFYEGQQNGAVCRNCGGYEKNMEEYKYCAENTAVNFGSGRVIGMKICQRNVWWQRSYFIISCHVLRWCLRWCKESVRFDCSTAEVLLGQFVQTCLGLSRANRSSPIEIWAPRHSLFPTQISQPLISHSLFGQYKRSLSTNVFRSFFDVFKQNK